MATGATQIYIDRDKMNCVFGINVYEDGDPQYQKRELAKFSNEAKVYSSK